ncbi:hypothetical protein ID866_9222 [Astraeus odoratus]|nr:hypothetical protein ID866_9222 [Astraeus odoratus]
MPPHAWRALLLHLVAAAILSYALLYVKLVRITGPSLKLSEAKGGMAQFLTMHGLVGSWVYVMLSLAQDIIPASTRFLYPIKRACLMVFLPIGFTVSIVYWSLRLFAPTLILGSAKSAHQLLRLPLPVDLAMHGAPMVALMADFLFFERKFSRQQMNRVAPVVMVAYGAFYSGMLEYLSALNGRFMYPFLNMSPFSVRLAIYVGSAGVGFGSLKFLNKMHP